MLEALRRRPLKFEDLKAALGMTDAQIFWALLHLGVRDLVRSSPGEGGVTYSLTEDGEKMFPSDMSAAGEADAR